MRKITKIMAIAVLAGSMFVSNAAAQSNVIKINYLSLILKTVNLGFEHAISDNASVQLQGYYWLGGNVGDLSYSGFGVTPEFRFYPGGSAPKGFFLAPYLRYQSWSVEDETTDIWTGVTYTAEGTYSSMGGGVLIGGQFLFGDVVSLDVYGGPGYNSGTLEWDSNYTGSADVSGDGFTFRFGSTIGFAF